MKTAVLRWARVTTVLVALSYGLVVATSPAQASPSVSVPITTPGLVSKLLPLYSCNTTYGISTMKPAKLPKDLRVLPHNSATKLAVFTDGLGIVRLVAPANWDCSAVVGADGSSSLTIVPPNAVARLRQTARKLHDSGNRRLSERWVQRMRDSSGVPVVLQRPRTGFRATVPCQGPNGKGGVDLRGRLRVR